MTMIDQVLYCYDDVRPNFQQHKYDTCYSTLTYRRMIIKVGAPPRVIGAFYKMGNTQRLACTKS
jgi:hypothetical protein